MPAESPEIAESVSLLKIEEEGGEGEQSAPKTCPVSGASASADIPKSMPIHVSDGLSLQTDTDDTLSVHSDKSENTVGSSNILHQEEKQTCPVVFTQEVDEDLLRTSLEDRIAYTTDFLNFTDRDSKIIAEIGPIVNQFIPGMVDDMYAKLFEFDVTKKIFMARNEGFNGPLPEKLEDLTLDSPQITFRKVFLKSWARRVLTTDYSNGKACFFYCMGTWAYMDKVGIMHTGESPFKHQRTMGIPPLNVPYRDCALTLGWVQTVIQTAILQVPEERLPMAKKIEGIQALTKVMWLQNDFFSRHYVKE
ncbi:hypothetical protein PUNSTDRAFT_104235 [Punctularia strigosozonata HHB-11173 SS5]|uniref:uncharacterized protein n=1 Tax=Punctularia strigosozonata (strain HHB-11173) TaxID=741275 RepID=UPI0004417167|nr:uncharacterized protein PUNSTDRAFT_104235 [Punctularia strigosozonata HHB-11173 SS5]EIN08029.1 hypothetical protein PUNSTDRAFT_104235 [Punctularia strigosozonata HHB-11173 SS5]